MCSSLLPADTGADFRVSRYSLNPCQVQVGGWENEGVIEEDYLQVLQRYEERMALRELGS